MELRPYGTMEVDERGRLVVGGCDAGELAEERGTPLLVVDEAEVRRTCREYVDAAGRHLPDSLVLYSAKAFMCSALCRILEEEGVGLDLVSGGELHAALRAGFPAQAMQLGGNVKTSAEMELALEAGIGRVVVDNAEELDAWARLASSRGARVRVLLRVAPGVEVDTHPHLRTGTKGSKFGFASGRETIDAARRAIAEESLEFLGLHAHSGSQVEDVAYLRRSAEALVREAAAVERACGARVRELNLGGGLGIDYSGERRTPSPSEAVKALAEELRAASARHGIRPPRALLEPGRSIVGEAGTTLYRVWSVKDRGDGRLIAMVDGGMGDNPRPVLYGARHPVASATRMGERPEARCTVVGRYCESGDVLAREVKLPRPRPGDVLAFFCTGAYTYSMSSAYNRVPRPEVVLVRDGYAETMIERERYEDLCRLERVPRRLEREAGQEGSTARDCAG